MSQQCVSRGALQALRHKLHKVQANEADDVPAVELTAGRRSSRLSAHHSFIHLHLSLHLHSELYPHGRQQLSVVLQQEM